MKIASTNLLSNVVNLVSLLGRPGDQPTDAGATIRNEWELIGWMQVCMSECDFDDFDSQDFSQTTVLIALKFVN